MCCASRFCTGGRGAAGSGPTKQNAGLGEHSEALTQRWKPGQEQHPGPENQDSQHMLNQPSGSFPDQNSPQKRGVWWVAGSLEISISLENFIREGDLEIFQSLGPLSDSEKRGLLEKGSFQKTIHFRDSREFIGAGVSQSSFFAIFIFEKSWSKCKHVFQPKDVTMDAHMLSLSMSA